MENQTEPHAIRPWLIIALAIVILAAVGFFGWNYYQNTKNTAVAKPTVSTTTPSTISTADWKTYTNDTYGFSFKYPVDSTVKDIASGNIAMPGILALYAVEINNDSQAPLSVIKVTSQTQDAEINYLKTWPVKTFPNGDGTFFDSIKQVMKYGKSATEVIFADKPSGTTSYYVVANGKTTFTISGDYPQYTDIEKTILSTFQFTK